MKWIGPATAVMAAFACAGVSPAFAHGAIAGTLPWASHSERGYFVHMAKGGHGTQKSVPFVGTAFRGTAFIGQTVGTPPPHAIPGIALASLALGHVPND